MEVIQIGDIKLQYDASKMIDIERIKNILSLNQNLFSDYHGKTISLEIPTLSNDDIVYIENFDEFFDNLLITVLKDQNFISSLEYPELLPALYLQILVRNIDKNKKTFIPINNEITDDMLWFYVACKYFDYENNFDDLSKFIKFRENKEILFDWLKETERFNTYNYLLQVFSNYLKKYDPYFINNLNNIVSKMEDGTWNYILSPSRNSNYELPKLSLDEFEKIFFEFLNEIKAPEEWKNLYIDLKNNNRILFEKSIDGKDNSECYKDNDGIIKIKVTTDGTIKFFVSFVHEFIHYISLRNKFIDSSLSEFPSIYFEKKAANYLAKIGYKEDIINKTIKDRNKNNFDIYLFISDVLFDLCEYNKKETITREQKIESYKKVIEVIYEAKVNNTKIQEEKTNQDFIKLLDYNYGELVDRECDTKISYFVQKGLNCYEYLIDSYLSEIILEKQDDNSILSKMVYITENLSDFNIQKVLKYLDIEDAFTEKKEHEVLKLLSKSKKI